MRQMRRCESDWGLHGGVWGRGLVGGVGKGGRIDTADCPHPPNQVYAPLICHAAAMVSGPCGGCSHGKKVTPTRGRSDKGLDRS